MPQVRAFTRADRDQLTELVNAHIAAVVPGWSIPVSALLAQLEREPAQYVVDPWVVDRTTLVATERDRVVAAAHLKRYGADARVSSDYHGAGELAWLVAWPQKIEAAHVLARACTDQLDQWEVTRQWADGALPTPATYGIPHAWPHVREVVEAAGFSDDDGRTETLLAGGLDALAEPGTPTVPGLTLRREVDNLAVRFTALIGDHVVGYVNVQDDLTRGGTVSRLAGWATLREHFVEPEYRRRGVGTWLVCHAISWLRLGGSDRMLATWVEDLGLGSLAFIRGFGWQEIGRTRRGWLRIPVTGPTRSGEGTGEVRVLKVEPTRWGRGLGRLLLAAAVNELRLGGHAAAILWVVEGNVRARRFYELAGWHLDGETMVDDRFGTGVVEVRYRLQLSDTSLER